MVIAWGIRTCSYVMSLPLCSNRASLWSSCVVLPLLALTWMSAVLAMTDKRSILFQILFAVFDSLQGFVIVMVHCILRREVRKIILQERRMILRRVFSMLTNRIFSFNNLIFRLKLVSSKDNRLGVNAKEKC